MRPKAVQTQTHMTTKTFSSPTTGRPPHPLLAFTGAVVTDVSERFCVYCLPVALFLVPPTISGGREKYRRCLMLYNKRTNEYINLAGELPFKNNSEPVCYLGLPANTRSPF